MTGPERLCAFHQPTTAFCGQLAAQVAVYAFADGTEFDWEDVCPDHAEVVRVGPELQAMGCTARLVGLGARLGVATTAARPTARESRPERTARTPLLRFQSDHGVINNNGETNA